MPVDDRTRQIMGVLHGGASAALAETIGSFAANMCVDQARYTVRGPGDQRQSPAAGGLGGSSRRRRGPFHIGTRSQVWHIEIHDERQRLVCVSRLTMAVVERRAAGECGMATWQIVRADWWA